MMKELLVSLWCVSIQVLLYFVVNTKHDVSIPEWLKMIILLSFIIDALLFVFVYILYQLEDNEVFG